MSQYKHRRLVSIPSFQCGEMPKISRARKVSTEADVVVSFVKSHKYLPYSSNFEKKFYLKRNSDVVEQRMCYNTRINVANKKELLKVLRLVADKDQAVLEKSINRGCVNEAVCTEFIKSNLSNVLPIVNGDQTDVFILRNVSYDAYCNKYTRKDQDRKQSSLDKISALKNILHRSQEEKKIGDIYFEFTSDTLKNVSFYIIMQVFEKACSLKSNTKQRMKKVLTQSTQEIRRYNLPVPFCLDGVISHENNMEKLLELNISNWKMLDYKFKSSKDESFYKQIRRKNRNLSEI